MTYKLLALETEREQALAFSSSMLFFVAFVFLISRAVLTVVSIGT